MSRLFSILALVFVLVAQGIVAKAESDHVAMPKIVNGTIAPRIVYIENPRFPSVTAEELQLVIQSASELVKDHFNVTVVQPGTVKTLNIDDIFEDLVTHKPDFFDDLIGDFRNGAVDWSVVKDFLTEEISDQTDPLSEQIDFARPYLTSPLAKDDTDLFADAVVETFKTRLKYWTIATLDDGNPVIGMSKPYNEYGYWSLMAKRGIESDIIFTNQLVASVEYMPISVHTSIRGGITGGSTEFNPASQYGSSVWVSLFPFVSEDDHIKTLRGGDPYTREQALIYAGAMLAHEMGHQLLHLGHPWSNKACVMRPAEVLDFASWVNNLDAAKCQIGSDAAMQPETIKIPVW